MASQPPLSRSVRPAPPPIRGIRVEYLSFEDVEECREFRLRVYGPEGSREFRMRVANAAFEDRRVRRQDGPDLCYQKLLRAVAGGVTLDGDVTTIDDVDMLAYRDEHTVAPKRRAGTPPPPPKPAAGPRRPYQYRSDATARTSRPTAPPVPSDLETRLEEGQRVNHAAFGMGVTTAITGARTAVFFDREGAKSFVTSMLEVEVLSAPHTWETGPRGTNRPCRAAGEAAESSVEKSPDLTVVD
jgi:hypothetical protein